MGSLIQKQSIMTIVFPAEIISVILMWLDDKKTLLICMETAKKLAVLSKGWHQSVSLSEFNVGRLTLDYKDIRYYEKSIKTIYYFSRFDSIKHFMLQECGFISKIRFNVIKNLPYPASEWVFVAKRSPEYTGVEFFKIFAYKYDIMVHRETSRTSDGKFIQTLTEQESHYFFCKLFRNNTKFYGTIDECIKLHRMNYALQ